MDRSDFQLFRLGSEYVYRGHISKIALLQLYYVIKITTFYGVSNSAGHTHAKRSKPTVPHSKKSKRIASNSSSGAIVPKASLIPPAELSAP